MYNTYTEMAHLKDLFTSKFDADKLFNCVMNTKSGCLLGFFEPKQLDKLSPSMIMKIMSEFKSDVIRAYNGRTKHKVLQAIIDYCYDHTKKPEKIMTLSVKDLEWVLGVYCHNICDFQELRKGRFKLSPQAKLALLKQSNLSYLSLFKDELKDSDFENHWKDNLKLITIMKNPTAEMLRAYYDEYHNVRDVPVVDYYPTDLLIELCENHALITSVLAENAPRYKGLLEVYDKLFQVNWYENDYGIDKLGDDELKTYEQLVNGDKDLLKKYVKDRLLEIN